MNHPNLVPGETWGSLKNEYGQKLWNDKKCNEIVGGKHKYQCTGKY